MILYAYGYILVSYDFLIPFQTYNIIIFYLCVFSLYVLLLKLEQGQITCIACA